MHGLINKVSQMSFFFGLEEDQNLYIQLTSSRVVQKLLASQFGFVIIIIF